MIDALFLIMLIFGRVYFQISLLDYPFPYELHLILPLCFLTLLWFLSLVRICFLIVLPLLLFELVPETSHLQVLIFHHYFSYFHLFFHFLIYLTPLELPHIFLCSLRNLCFYHNTWFFIHYALFLNHFFLFLNCPFLFELYKQHYEY